MVTCEANLANAESIFYTYKKLIQLRKKNEIVVWGEYTLLENTPPEVFAYQRTLNDEVWLVVANISRNQQQWTMPGAGKEVIISNYHLAELPQGEIMLQPYEAFVIRQK